MNGRQVSDPNYSKVSVGFVGASGQITYVVGPSEFVVRAFRLPY